MSNSGYARITRPNDQGGPKSSPVAPKATKEQIAWAAGIVEGEGYLHTTGRNVRLEVMMNDKDVLERLQEWFGGVIMGPYFYSHQTHPSWRWGLYRQEHVRPALRSMLPWFGSRRAAKAHEVLGDV